MTLEQYTEQIEERTAILQEFGILINQTLPDYPNFFIMRSRLIPLFVNQAFIVLSISDFFA